MKFLEQVKWDAKQRQSKEQLRYLCSRLTEAKGEERTALEARIAELQKSILSEPAQAIFDAYRRLLSFRKRFRGGDPLRYLALTMGIIDNHLERYLHLQGLLRSNHDALLELMLSGHIDDDAINNLMRIGGHGGSVMLKDNLHWAPFIAKMREHRSEFSVVIQMNLDWLLNTHGY